MRPGPAILGGGLLAVLVLATLGNAGSQPDVLFAWHAVLFVTVLASWWFAVPGGTGRRPAAGVGLALAVLVLVVVIGFARAAYTYAAWMTVVEVAAFIATFMLAIRNGSWLVTWMGPVLVLVGWFQTALLVFQRFVLENPRPAGTFLNPNYLAGWFAATILFCAGRWIAAPDSCAARWYALATAPLFAGFVLSGSRGALIGIVAGGMLLAALVWPALKPGRRRGLVALLVVVGLAGGATLALRMRQPDPYRYQRLKIWQASLTPLLSAPWAGSGPGQFVREAPNLQFPDGRGALRYDRGFRTTHSDWIRVAAEFGWPGVAAFGWIVVSVLAHVARRRRSSDPVDAAALAALACLFVHAGVDNLSRAPALYLLGAAFFGVVTAVEGPARRTVRPSWRLFAVGVAVHLFLIGDLAPWRGWSERGATPAPSGSALRATVWNPADAEASMLWAEVRLSQGLHDLSAYAAARPLAERAVQLSPRDGELLRRLARIEVAAVGVLPFDRAGRERIASLYRDSEALQRSNPGVPIELAAFLLDAGDPAGARRAAERALNIEPQAVAPRLLLARALLEAGDPERARKLMDEMESLMSRNSAEAQTSDYARDLLTVDPALVRQVRAGIEAARQAESAGARFDPGSQEDEAGSSRSMD